MNVNLAEICDDRGDAWLVSEALRGNREAFGEIVARYQNLICSITYSGTGSLSRSEDLAQETFITAWRELGRLREPGKLREWLSGIARNLARNARRKDLSEPAERGEGIETLAGNAAEDPSPTEAAISLEEQAILWRALEQVPDLYREPMVLFYREHQNVRQVASQLELSEDAVKQRLARGRKLLASEVEKFVEGALSRSLPGRAFTLATLGALPLLPVSATAATVGATAMKGTATASSASALGGLAAVAGPLVGLAGAWMGVRAALREAKSARERRFIIKSAVCSFAGILSFLLLLGALIYGGRNHWQAHGPQLEIALAGLVVLYVAALLAFVFVLNRRLRKIQMEEAAGMIPASASFPRREYRSKATFLGWPLVHAAFGQGPDGRQAVARGWIAVGDVAVGVLAFGGAAVGAVAFGGVAVGLFTLGGAALGLLAFGGLSIGAFAAGGMALGMEAAGGCAIALKTAYGGAALAAEHALGGMAWAPHANDDTARVVVEQSRFFSCASWMMDHSRALVVLPLLLVFALPFWHRKRNTQQGSQLSP